MRIISSPFCFALCLMALLPLGLTECNYDNFTVWEGNCSGAYLTHDSQNIYLNLNCPGTIVRHTPSTRDVPLVSAFGAKTLPDAFYCRVARSGNATCWLPKVGK